MSVKTHKTTIYHIPNFAQYVGFYTAHMVWSLEEGDNVAPLFGVQNGNEACFERFEGESYENAAAKAKEQYNSMSLSNGDYALLGYDGFLTRGDKREESLFIHAFENRGQAGMAFAVIVPYISARNAGGLIIGQIEIFSPKNFSDSDKNLFLNNFKKGAYNHTKGFEFWYKHWDRNSEPILM
mgnify:CR=1 FL=1